jgi:hypothetical protein
MSPPLQLFDAHCVIGPMPWGEPGFADAAALLRHMDAFGIGEALVSHSGAWRHEPMSGNRELVAETWGHPRLRPCWVALPGTCGEVPSATDFTSEAEQARVSAFRAYPREHGFDLDGPDFRPYAAAFAARGTPLILDAQGSGWAAVDALLEAHPALVVILTGTGYRALRRVAGLLHRHPGLRLDLSDVTSHEGFDWVCHEFGAERVVFGTGAPLRDAGEAIARLLWSDVSEDDVRRVGSENLRRLITAGVAR